MPVKKRRIDLTKSLVPLPFPDDLPSREPTSGAGAGAGAGTEIKPQVTTDFNDSPSRKNLYLMYRAFSELSITLSTEKKKVKLSFAIQKKKKGMLNIASILPEGVGFKGTLTRRCHIIVYANNTRCALSFKDINSNQPSLLKPVFNAYTRTISAMKKKHSYCLNGSIEYLNKEKPVTLMSILNAITILHKNHEFKALFKNKLSTLYPLYFNATPQRPRNKYTPVPPLPGTPSLGPTLTPHPGLPTPATLTPPLSAASATEPAPTSALAMLATVALTSAEAQKPKTLFVDDTGDTDAGAGAGAGLTKKKSETLVHEKPGITDYKALLKQALQVLTFIIRVHISETRPTVTTYIYFNFKLTQKRKHPDVSNYVGQSSHKKVEQVFSTMIRQPSHDGLSEPLKATQVSNALSETLNSDKIDKIIETESQKLSNPTQKKYDQLIKAVKNVLKHKEFTALFDSSILRILAKKEAPAKQKPRIRSNRTLKTPPPALLFAPAGEIAPTTADEATPSEGVWI